MTITFPLANLTDSLKIQSVKWLLESNQETSGMASGAIIVADLGPRYWTAEVEMGQLTHGEAVQAQAIIESLDGGMNDFYLHDPRIPYPQSDPGGKLLTNGSSVTIGGVAASGDAINGTYRYEDRAVTFTEAVLATTPTGTYFDADGILQTAPANVARIDYGAFGNLLRFPNNFETTYWNKFNSSCIQNAAIAPDGTMTADKLNDNATNSIHTFDRQIPAAASTIYTTSVYLKAGDIIRANVVVDAGGNNYANVWVDLQSGVILSGGSFTGFSNYSATITNVGTGWYRVTLTYRTHASATQMYVAVRTSSLTSDFYAGTGQGIFVWGLITNLGATALAYPRKPLGIRMEYNTAQMLAWSQQFDNPAWGKNALTVSANWPTTTNIDGLVTSDKLIENNTLANHYFFYPVTGTAGTRYVFYAILKAAERTKVIIQLSNNIGSAAEARYNLLSGTIEYTVSFQTDFGAVTSSMTNLGDGWWQCEISAIKGGANANVWPIIYLVNSASASNYTGDGVSGVYIGHAQLEAAAVGSYPIISTSAAVSRATDYMSIKAKGINNWSFGFLNSNPGFANIPNTFIAGNLFGWLQTWTATRAAQPGEPTVTIAEISANNKEIKLSGLPAFYTLTAGDMMAFDFGSNPVHRGLHRFVSSVTADIDGLTPWIELRPHLSPGVTVGTLVTLKKPAARVKLVPKSFNPGTGRRSITSGMTMSVRQVV